MKAKQFQKQVARLRGWREFAFLVALAERGYPNFALYAELTDPASAGVVRRALDQCWLVLGEKDQALDPYRTLTRLEQARPDPERHDFYGVSPALDAWLILEQALLSRGNPKPGRAQMGSELALGTVIRFVEFQEGDERSDDEWVRFLDQHELVTLERAYQETLVRDLLAARQPGATFTGELRELAENDGVSNLGLAMTDAGDETP